MASTGKSDKYGLPLFLVVLSFALITVRQFIWSQRYGSSLFSSGWFLTLLIIPAILPLALLCLHKVRLKWLHAVFESLCILTLAVSAFYAVFGFLSVVGVSFSFIPLTYMPYFRAGFVLMNLYQLLLDDIMHLMPLVTNTLILISLLMTTRLFHALSRRRR